MIVKMANIVSPFRVAVLMLIYLTYFENNVAGDSELSKIFGSNVDKDDAWAKLFELEGCPKPELWAETIIMVNESVSAGARFMENPNVTSRYECEFECCYKKDKGCNIAVYTGEKKHCYLFDCGRPSKCKFDQHTGYSVSSIAKELSPNILPTVPTTQPTTKASSTTESSPQKQHLLDGCRPGIDSCVTEHTECSNTGYCMCKKGFHPKNGVCRQDCIDGLQFECTNGDSKFGKPDCIAVYDVCDRTPQCPDGSDEKDCDIDDNIDWSKLADVPTLKAALKGNEQQSTDTDLLDPVIPPDRLDSVNNRKLSHNMDSFNHVHSSDYGNLQRKNGMRMATVPPFYGVDKSRNGYSDKYGKGENSYRKALSPLYNSQTAYPSWYRDMQQQDKWADSSYGSRFRNPYMNHYDRDSDYYPPYEHNTQGPQSKSAHEVVSDNDEDALDYSQLFDEYLKQRIESSTSKTTATSTVRSVPDEEDIKEMLGGSSKQADDHEEQLSGLTSVATTKTTSNPITLVNTSTRASTNQSGVVNKAVEIDKQSPKDIGSRSAVVALSLTVSLTLVLLVYLGCKYRKMKRRVIRPGKAMNGSEIDYLIDGMYL